MNLFVDERLGAQGGVLEGDEARHCCRVLRLRQGDAVHVTDGRGRMASCRLTGSAPDACRYVVESLEVLPPRSFRLHIALAPPKSSDRLEWFIEKATECGIETITPLLSSRSERTRLNYGRLAKIMAGAMKQSLRAHLPVIEPAAELGEVLRTASHGGKFIAHRPPGAAAPHLKTLYGAGTDAIVLIGPEGGFTEEEVGAARAAGFRDVSLGPARLRTETAALTACQVMNFLNET